VLRISTFARPAALGTDLLRLPTYFRYLLRAYLVIMAICTLFRLLLLAMAFSTWKLTPPDRMDLGHAFFIGWRFDTVVACYLLATPFLVLSFAHVTGSRWPMRTVHAFLCVCGIPVLLILAADIPWFLHTYARLSTSALLWSSNQGYMAKMVFQERSFWLYLLPFIGGYALWGLGLRWSRTVLVAHAYSHDPPHGFRHISTSLAGALLLGGTLFLGMRGRLDEKSPIQNGTAYFGSDPLLNQLGLNPVFTFGASMGRKDAGSQDDGTRMTDRDAVWNALRELGGDQRTTGSPIARNIVPEGPMDSANVVVILLESMSTFKMGQYGGPQGLTPFLNSLRKVSLDCDHAYSAGIHTFNGIYSTLYSFPALYDQQPLEDWLNKKHQGLANVLSQQGYRTLFCTTHDPEFDNMKGFLLSQGFDRVISEDDYPSEWVASTNGVPDHRMFEHVVPELSKLALHGPFLSVFMTTSDHKPYILPDHLWFEPTSEKLEDQMVEYVDASVARFFELAKKEPWYAHTVFVILGDHGINMGHTYDMPLSFHHTPLLFYSPSGQLSPGRLSAPCGQIDVAPTLLGMLNVPWTNSTMGLDILRRRRPFMYFCADDRVGCIDSTHYFIHRGDGNETLYRYADLSTDNLLSSSPEKVDAMKRYAYSMMRTTQWLVDQDLLDGGPNRTDTVTP
jgi:phosphoglycerol transferase MdoB-like AlkP superfamily enzyme